MYFMRIITSYTMGFYEITVDIRAIFSIFSVFHEPTGELNTEKIPKNYENITGISEKHMV